MKWLITVYRGMVFPPAFKIEHARGCYLLYKGYRTGDHAFTAVGLRKKAWERHDAMKKAENVAG